MATNSDASADKLDKLLAGLDSLTKRMDTIETKTTVKADAEGLTANKEGEPLDKVLAHLDSITKRLDAMDAKHSAECDSMRKRMDSFEEKKQEKVKGDGEGKDGDDKKEEKNVKEGGEPTPLAADKTKKDGEEQGGKETDKKALEEEREENKLKANDAARADAATIAALRADLESMGRRIPVEMPEADRRLFVDAQLKAERVAQAFGDSAGAPRWLNGEDLSQYRRRLLNSVKQHSKAWKDIDLTPFASKALDTVETQVYADAMQAAMHPTNIEAGSLREVVSQDETGRRIKRFYGDPEACWGPFKQQSRIVTGWNTKPQH